MELTCLSLNVLCNNAGVSPKVCAASMFLNMSFWTSNRALLEAIYLSITSASFTDPPFNKPKTPPVNSLLEFLIPPWYCEILKPIALIGSTLIDLNPIKPANSGPMFNTSPLLSGVPKLAWPNLINCL